MLLEKILYFEKILKGKQWISEKKILVEKTIKNK